MKKVAEAVKVKFRFVGLILVLLVMLFSSAIKPPANAQLAPSLKFTVAASGVTASNGRDTSNQFSFDGFSYQNAYVLDPLPAELQNVYPTISGTKWISVSNDGGRQGYNGARTLYRSEFSLPLSGSPKTCKIRIHADNAATIVSVNNRFVGAQPDCSCYENFDNPETQFSIPISFLKQQGNFLDIQVRNYNSYTALNYKIVVEY